jgi:hypothetical protein
LLIISKYYCRYQRRMDIPYFDEEGDIPYFDEEGNITCRSQCVGCLIKATKKNKYGTPQCEYCFYRSLNFRKTDWGSIFMDNRRIIYLFDDYKMDYPKLDTIDSYPTFQFCRKCHKKIFTQNCSICN